MPLDELEMVLTLLDDSGPLTLDDLGARSGLGLGAVNRVLCDLLLAGLVRPEHSRVRGRRVTRYHLPRKEATP